MTPGNQPSAYRSRAPLRLGLAGGASDVSPFCDRYGGYVLNATIDAYAYCHLVPTDEKCVRFTAVDREEKFEAALDADLGKGGSLPLHRAVHQRIVRQFNRGEPLPVSITTSSDAPVGSGLGASSTLSRRHHPSLHRMALLLLGEYDMAQLAFSIEREDAGLLGGRQDQYAATFGGFNFMEFYAENRVIVNPLRIRATYRARTGKFDCRCITPAFPAPPPMSFAIKPAGSRTRMPKPSKPRRN